MNGRGPLVRVPPAGGGGREKNQPPSPGRSRGGGLPKRPLGAAEARTALAFSLSPGPVPAAPVGRQWRNRLDQHPDNPSLLRDRADEGAKTRHLAAALGEDPVVPSAVHPGGVLGVCPRAGQAAHRNRAGVSPVAGIPSPLLALRAEATCYSSDASSSHSSLTPCDSVNRP